MFRQRWKNWMSDLLPHSRKSQSQVWTVFQLANKICAFFLWFAHFFRWTWCTQFGRESMCIPEYLAGYFFEIIAWFGNTWTFPVLRKVKFTCIFDFSLLVLHCPTLSRPIIECCRLWFVNCQSAYSSRWNMFFKSIRIRVEQRNRVLNTDKRHEPMFRMQRKTSKKKKSVSHLYFLICYWISSFCRCET